MCGISGFWSPRPVDPAEAAAIAERMANEQRHRGPDDSGAWVHADAGLALSHRRLSIVDLTASGHQPMLSASGRFVISFNGEIYNHRALRAELEAAGAAPAWRGHSDTEVLLAAVEHWGLAATLERSVGMFAIALWDREERTLHLARDRIGEKPLYYGFAGDTFVFASELKAMRVHPRWQGEIDRESVAFFIRYSAMPAPRSIYRDVRQLSGGTLVTIRLDDVRSRTLPGPVAYWSLPDVVARAGRGIAIDETAAIDELERLLVRAISDQMVADVPVGAFLSGGIDSSTVVALMQRLSPRPVRTFSIGFTEAEYNEADKARALAGRLGTEHVELIVKPADALAVIPRLSRLYDEPFADSSQIPTILVAQLARRDVTVSLTGDGGDELFGGYNRYLWSEQMGRRLDWLPPAARRGLASIVSGVPPRAWDGLFGLAAPFAPSRMRVEMPGDKLHKLARLVDAPDEQALTHRMLAPWQDVPVVAGGVASMSDAVMRAPTREARMMLYDVLAYLPDTILTKVDRAAMSVSLETRIPLLDHRIVEFAFSLPQHLKLRGGQGKWLLRRLLDRVLPNATQQTEKRGFSIPLDQWLRGPLRDWADGLLDPSRVAGEGFLDASVVSEVWNEHRAGKRNWQYRLWNVIMFEAWLERERQRPSVRAA